MTEENKDDVRRVEFAFDEKELQFDRREDKTLFDNLDTSPEGILENPINLLLSNFDNEYMHNERMGIVMFDSMNSALRKYSKMVNENYHYQDMELVYVINDLLTRYNAWIANQRGLLLITREFIRRMKAMIDKEYTTNKSIENFKEEIKLQMQEDQRGSVESMVLKTGEDLVIVLPKNTKFKNEDFVLIKKSNKIK